MTISVGGKTRTEVFGIDVSSHKMRKYAILTILFQALDILTTVIGIECFGFIEMNPLITYMSLTTLILLKVVIVTFVVIIMMWREASANKIYNLIWITSAIPVVWNVLNLALEISL